jgi:hypothetical protein
MHRECDKVARVKAAYEAVRGAMDQVFRFFSFYQWKVDFWLVSVSVESESSSIRIFGLR